MTIERGGRGSRAGLGVDDRAGDTRTVPFGRHPALLRRPVARARSCSDSRRASGSRTAWPTSSVAFGVSSRWIALTSDAASSPRAGSRAERDGLACTTSQSSSSRRTRHSGYGPASRSVFAHAGGTTGRHRRRQRVDRRDARARRREFPEARVVLARTTGSPTPTTVARTRARRYVLFLNPDTEVLDGTFAELVAASKARPDVGLAASSRSRLTVSSSHDPRFPTAPARSERPGFGAAPDPAVLARRARARHGRGTSRGRNRLDVGLVHVARREALQSAGFLDERFFIYSEEVDLCLRIRQAGWKIVHLPADDHPAPHGKGRHQPPDESSGSVRTTAVREETFRGVRRASCVTALYVGHGIRALAPGPTGGLSKARRTAARAALRALGGSRPAAIRPPAGTRPRPTFAARRDRLKCSADCTKQSMSRALRPQFRWGIEVGR